MKLTESILKRLIKEEIKNILEEKQGGDELVRVIGGKRYWVPKIKEFIAKNPSVDEPMLRRLAHMEVLPGYLGDYGTWDDLPVERKASESINFTVKAPKIVKQGLQTRKRGG